MGLDQELDLVVGFNLVLVYSFIKGPFGLFVNNKDQLCRTPKVEG